MKTMIKKLLLLLVFLPCSMMAQTMSGVVSDAMGPLPGVNIVVQGTSNGTATDFDGNYTLNNLKKGDVVVFSFMGFKDFKVTYAGQAKQNVTMAEDAQALDEVVVVGYGAVKKEDLTGSVSLVTAKDFNKGAINSVDGLLNGRTPGVNVTSSGTPGNGATIRVRGMSSLQGNNDPLIVVDGLPITGGLSSVNPNDIASFSILKDASATAIYGNRGANGVILITTKRGSAESLKVSVNMFTTYNTLARKLKVYDANEYRSVINRDLPQHAGLLGNANTDWQDEIFENTFTTDISASILGNLFGKVPARLTLGNNNNNGILLTSQYKRSTASFSLNPSLFDDHLKINATGNYSYAYQRKADEGAIGAALSMDPTQPVYDSNSPFGYYEHYVQDSIKDAVTGKNIPLVINGQPQYTPKGTANPVATLKEKKEIENQYRFFGNLNLDYKLHFLPELHAIANFGTEHAYGNGSTRVNQGPRSSYYSFNIQGQPPFKIYQQNYSHKNWSSRNSNMNLQLNYKKEFGKLSLDVLGGYEYQLFDNRNWDSNGNIYDPNTVADKSLKPIFNLQAFLGRANIGYNDKYLLTFNFRRDGSAKVSPVNKWDNFSGLAFAWKMKQESFLKESNLFSDLKLRLSYGQTGNQDIGDGTEWLKQYNTSEVQHAYQFGNGNNIEWVQFSRPDGYNTNLKWERSTKYNAGIDYGLNKGKLTGTVDWYYSKTTDLFSQRVMGALQNLYILGPDNVGSLVGTGLEFSLNYKVINNENASLDFNYNVGYNKLEITDLFSDNLEKANVGLGANAEIHSIGYAPFTYYVYQQVYDSNGRPIEGAYVDRNQDGVVDSSDKYHYKTPQAEVTMGFMTNASYKKWDFSMAWRASFGNYVYDDVSAGRSVQSGIYNQVDQTINNAPTNYDDTQFKFNRKVSDYYIKNGDFLKLDNITIGYNFNKVFSEKSDVRLSLGVQNALMITKYKGIDPEVFGDQDRQGIDGSIYPRARMYMLGASINF